MNINALDSPLEALALNYLSFGVFTVVKNLWTWVAILTAAISFWRIRTTVKPEKQQQSHRYDPNAVASHPIHDVSPSSPSPSPSPAPASIPTLNEARPLVCDVKDVAGTTKGSKFSLYYYSEKSGSRRELTEVKSWIDDYVAGDECVEWWERLISARIGDMGWYRNQDLTVVNDKVVRFWDEYSCRRRESHYSYNYSYCSGAW